MVDRTYLERGSPVVVVVRWGAGGGPRNVLLQRADGSRVVRPFVQRAAKDGLSACVGHPGGRAMLTR